MILKLMSRSEMKKACDALERWMESQGIDEPNASILVGMFIARIIANRSARNGSSTDEALVGYMMGLVGEVEAVKAGQ